MRWTKDDQIRLNILRRKELDRTLTAAEQAELAMLMARVEAEEAEALAPEMARLRAAVSGIAGKLGRIESENEVTAQEQPLCDGATTAEHASGVAYRPGSRYSRTIMSDVDSVLAAALRLPADARAALAAELIQSLDEPEQPAEDVEAAWSEEIQQRLADVDAGVVTPVPWPEARRRIFAAANGRRETP